jgi:hypothetical protein
MRRRVAENQSVKHIYMRWNVSIPFLAVVEEAIPIPNLKAVKSKQSTGVNMSNYAAVIQGDIAPKLDKIGFGHKHCTPASTQRAVPSNLCP